MIEGANWLQSRAQHWVPMPMPITAHAHGFLVGMDAILLVMGGHGCDIIEHGWAWVSYYNRWAWVRYYCSWEHGLKQSILEGVIE